MTSSLSRRSLVAAVAPAALFAPTLPALATEPGPIEAMWPEHLRLESIVDAAVDRHIEAEDRYEAPARPIWHPLKSAGGYEIWPTTKGRGHIFVDLGEANLSLLRARAADFRDTDENGFVYLEGDRARKTLAEVDAYLAEVKRRKDAAGLTESEASMAQAYAEANAHRTAMLAIEATNFRELAHQAALFEDDWRQAEGERIVARLAELAGIIPYGQL